MDSLRALNDEKSADPQELDGLTDLDLFMDKLCMDKLCLMDTDEAPPRYII